ncbi:hypothetical protein U1Q18_033150 [Sarracenia purpurea var. burkii]
MRLHEINTLEWEELLVPDDPELNAPNGGNNSCFEQKNQFGTNGFTSNGTYVEGIKEEVALSPGHALSLIAAGEGIH